LFGHKFIIAVTVNKKTPGFFPNEYFFCNTTTPQPTLLMGAK
jgi:hypothetical protein